MPGAPYTSNGSIHNIVLNCDGAVAWESLDSSGLNSLWGTVQADQPPTTLSKEIVSGSLTSL